MSNLKIGETDVTKMLEKSYVDLRSGWVVLVTVNAKNYSSVNVESIRLLSQMGYSGIYITVSKGYDELKKFFKKEGISTKNFYFVDAISKLYGETRDNVSDCTFISGPLNVDAISGAVYEAIPSILGDKKFVFIDSLTALMLYNSAKRTVRFSKFLTETLKKTDVTGVFVSVLKDKQNEDLVKELSSIADEVIDLGGGV